MKKAVLFIFLFFPSFCLSQPRIDVVYPKPEQALTASDSSFIFGNVQPPQSRLWINGTEVPLYKNGAFLAFLPLSPGKFVFRCVAVSGGDTTVADIPVEVPHLPVQFRPDSLGADSTSFYPVAPALLLPGDEVTVRFRATPGCSARFKIEGLKDWHSLAQKNYESGYYWGSAVFGDAVEDTVRAEAAYEGKMIVPDGAHFSHAAIQVQLFHPSGDVLSFQFGDLSVAADSLPRVAELLPETTILRTGPDLVYHLFLPRGTKVLIDGKRDYFWRVRLSETKYAWLPENTFRWLPPGTPEPTSVVPLVRTQQLKGITRLIIPLQERLPFQIKQQLNPQKLVLTIWGAVSATEWIRYDHPDPVLRDIRWRQPQTRTFELEIPLQSKQQWGYLAHYEGTHLLVDIRHPPRIVSNIFRSPLKGKVIVLDAGHHPDQGAIGPTRLEERDANWEITVRLKRLLEKKGAIVYLTRTKEQGMALSARPKYATLVEADVLLSIHNNALPDGVNPFRHNGSSVYYYHPQSYRLAKLLLNQLLRSLKLPNHGLYYANLALCRPTFMPAVLVEPAFMMVPEQEAMLRQPKYQEKIARALLKGLEKYFRDSK